MKGPHIVRAVLLDIDGTLIDSNAAHAEAWLGALRECGVDAGRAHVRRLIGMGSDKLLPDVAKLESESPEGQSILARKKALFAERLPQLRATPGARELLETLRSSDIRLVVATSADEEEATALLKQAGLEDLLATKTSSDDVEDSKPDPDIVHAALAKAGVGVLEALLVGDTPYDIAAAWRAGVAAVALRCGGFWSNEALSDAVATFDNPHELCAAWNRLWPAAARER